MGGDLWKVVGAVISAAVLLTYLALWGTRYGLDMEVYRGGIRELFSGRDPYSYLYTIHKLAFTYPPPALMFLAPFEVGSLAFARVMLWVGTAAGLSAALYVCLRRSRDGRGRLERWCLSVGLVCIAGVLLEPLRSDLDYGQVDGLIMALVLIDLLAVPRKWRGWLLGSACAIKLVPAVFVIYLIVIRDWKAVCRAVGVVVAALAVFWVAWPVTTKQYLTHYAWDVGRIGSIVFSGNQSWTAVLRCLGVSGYAGDLTWILLSALSVAMATVVCASCVRRGRDVSGVFAVAICALLVSPISWTHEWVWLLLIPVIFLSRERLQLSVPVRVLMWILLGLGLLAPFSWTASHWESQGLADLLPVMAGVTVVWWGCEELSVWRQHLRVPELVNPADGATECCQ